MNSMSEKDMFDRDENLKSEFNDFLEAICIPGNIVRDFYIFVALVTDWLDRNGIPYFIHSGTALGAVRHQGFIPWDDDFDIMVEEVHEKKLLDGVSDLNRYGVILSEKHNSNGHYQFFFKHPRVLSTNSRYYCFDIFIGARESINGCEVLHYKHPDFRRWFEERYCKILDTYPLVKVPFGPLMLWAMRDPMDYFSRSAFQLDQATLRIHMIDQEWLAERIRYFESRGLYPIRDESVLRRKVEFEFEYAGLDGYRID